MQSRIRIFTLSSLLAVPLAAIAGDLPQWIVRGPVIDSGYHYVVCSHDGLDPEDVKQVAEAKCLASAAKLGGVTVTISQKTVQSLTGADSSEIAEVQPLRKDIRCEWTERYLEKVGQGFRVWLRCRVKKIAVTVIPTTSGIPDKKEELKKLSYQRGIFTLTTMPQADRVIVGGANGERVIEAKSNVLTLEVKEGDEWLVAKKHGYKDERHELGSWKQGDSKSATLYLKSEM